MVQVRRLFLYLLPLALFVILTILLSSGIGKDPTYQESNLIGKALPNFSKKNLMKIKSTITEKDFKGPALINIFGSWCPACYHEHPFLMKLAASEAINIYGVNYNDELQPALEFIKQQGNPYDLIVFDDNGRLGIELGVYGAPETFLINKDQRIIYRHVGVMSETIWKTKILPLLDPANAKQATQESDSE
jgi:cytochrome c biogenesis protein CcmG/thiol:disulfide interchange protein DsbE